MKSHWVSSLSHKYIYTYKTKPHCTYKQMYISKYLKTNDKERDDKKELSFTLKGKKTKIQLILR